MTDPSEVTISDAEAARWHDEAAQHDQHGLDYSDLVGIPLSNAEEVRASVDFHIYSAAAIRWLGEG